MINYNEKRQEYIKKLEALPYGAGVLVLPNISLQRDVKLHHMVKCIGLDTLAVEVINFLGTQRLTLIDRMTQELIVSKILQEHKDDLQYFGSIIQKDGLVSELVNLFTELRRCHVCTSDELDTVFQMWEEDNGYTTDGIIAPVTKNHDVALLFRAYLAHLKDGLCDIEGQYVEAIRLLQENADRTDELQQDGERFFCDYYLSDMPFFNQLQMDFVHELSSFMRRAGKKVVWEYETKVLEFSKEYKNAIEGKRENIVLRKYASHRDELIGVFRDIKQLLNVKDEIPDVEKVLPKEVCIVIRNFKNFSGVESLAKEYGIPVVLPHQEVLGLQPLCQQLLEKITEQGTAEELALRIKSLFEDGMYEKEFGRQYVDGHIGMGELQIILQSKKAILNCAAQLVQSYKLSGMQDHVLSITEFKGAMSQLFRLTKITLSNGTDNGVVLTDLFGALGRSFKYVYVLGMNDGEFTDQISENWIYNDNQHEGIEKVCRKKNQTIYGEGQSQFMRSIGFEMFTSRQKYQENDYYFLELLRTATDRMIFSWTENETSFPCGYVLTLLNMFDGIKEEDWRSSLAREQKKQPLSDNEYQCANIVCNVNGTEYYDVDKQRLADKKEYLGVIGEYGYREPVNYSTSKIEVFAKCPFAYMAQYVWQLNTFTDDEDDLNPLQDGTFMHKVMETFVRKYILCHKDGNGRVKHYRELGTTKEEVYGMLRVQLDHIFNEEFHKLVGLTQYQKQQIEKTKQVLLKWFDADFECEWGKDYKTKAAQQKAVANRYSFFSTEKSFEPVKLWDGEITFTGKIDRIDVKYDSADEEKEPKITGVRIVDYKRGAYPKEEADLQIQIYQQVVNNGLIPDIEYLKNVPTTGIYSSFRKGKSCKKRDLRDDLIKTLIDYTEQIKQGNFNYKNVRNCSNCDFMWLCRQNLTEGEE